MTMWGKSCAGLVVPLALATLFCARHESSIADRIKHLRDVPDAERGAVTRTLALEIRRLPASKDKLTLANNLAELSTEGDFGHDTLQEVATTLSQTLGEQGGAPDAWAELAQLVHYERVAIPGESDPAFKSAMARLEADDQLRAHADFTLADLQGKTWTLHELRGKVVLVNFWATWCPPCRKEMPDLNALHGQFAAQGLVILAISDEDAAKVKPFIEQRKILTRSCSIRATRCIRRSPSRGFRRASSTTAMGSSLPRRSICGRAASFSACSARRGLDNSAHSMQA